MLVYDIRSKRGGKSRTVHRHLLVPCDSFALENNKRQDIKFLIRNRGKTKQQVLILYIRKVMRKVQFYGPLNPVYT